MEKYDHAFFEWVDSHAADDPLKLRLKYHGQSEMIDDAISMIECRRKAGNKFHCRYSESWVPELMVIPLSVEQATGGNVAWLHRLIVERMCNKNPRILDMTCGQGIDCGYLSGIPGAEITAIDLNPKVADMARYNFRNVNNVNIINADSITFLKDSAEKYDVIFIDPARRGNAGQRVYNIHDCSPDVSLIMSLLKEHTRHVFIKLSPMLDVTQTFRDLPETKCIHVIDDNGECRELLVEIDFSVDKQPSGLIIAWHNDHATTFNINTESDTATDISGVPVAGQYLYEPSPAMMKAGQFNQLAQQLSLSKLHRFTHLYISDTVIDNFPGKCYKIDEVIPFSSSVIKQIAKKYPVADVATRNFGIETDALRRRLKIKQGGDTRVMATTCSDSQRYLLILKPVLT